MVRVQRPDLKKYFYHTSINFPTDENVSNELMIKIGREYLEANGLINAILLFRHHDLASAFLHSREPRSTVIYKKVRIKWKAEL